MIGSDIKNSIKGWYFLSNEIEYSLEHGEMLNPSIDFTNACNLNCPYCYIEEKNSIRKKRKSNEISLLQTLKTIDQLANCKSKAINIVGAGEPTVDENFEEIIKYIFKKGLTTVLFTNGILLSNNPRLVKFLHEHDVSVILKYNSSNNEIQDLVAGKKGYSEKRDKALDLLLKNKFNLEYPTRIGIDIMSFRGNIKEIPNIHRWCRENNIYPLAGDYIPTGRTDNGLFQGDKTKNNFNTEDSSKIIKLLQPISSEDRLWLLNELSSIDNLFGIKREGCFAYFGGSNCTQILGLYIDIEGNIWPCIARKKNINGQLLNGLLGNIKNDNLEEIWSKNIYLKEIRGKFDGGCPYKPKLIFNDNKSL
ncbi:MAG: radical SAM protein [Chitinophagales bacterium]|nr:radical SAM protein [Chitinophagales bacterium]